jgi:hypothetical protein
VQLPYRDCIMTSDGLTCNTRQNKGEIINVYLIMDRHNILVLLWLSNNKEWDTGRELFCLAEGREFSLSTLERCERRNIQMGVMSGQQEYEC